MSQLRALRQRLISHYRTRYIPKAGVSILSDDCWAGRIYAELGTPCRSPFVGMHFDSNESFVQRFERRKRLIDWDQLLIKIDLGKAKYRPNDIEQWNEIKRPRAIAFHPDQPEYKELAIHRGVAVKDWSPDGATMFYSSCRHFDMFSFLQRGEVRFSTRRIIAQYLMFKHRLLSPWL